MSKLNVVIMEDEIPVARLLHSMVSGLHPQWTLTMIPGNIDGVVAWFHEHLHPDLTFLDIHLADRDVSDFLSAVYPSSVITFTTAYDQYVIRVFMVNSIDYILKPIDEKRLPEVTVKYESSLNNEVPRLEDYLGVLPETLQHKEERYRTRFLISGVNRFWSLRVADIAYFYSENKVMFAVTRKSQGYVIDLSLSKLMEQLDPERSFRVNRQVLVSIDAIDHAESLFNGEIVITVRPPYKSKVMVSEEKFSAFKLWLNH